MNERDIPTIKDIPEGFSKNYRKKPIVIQAVQWDGTMYCADLLHQWSRGDVYWDEGLRCKTLEGDVYVGVRGCYIICGVEGEFYFCAESIFKLTYEEA